VSIAFPEPPRDGAYPGLRRGRKEVKREKKRKKETKCFTLRRPRISPYLVGSGKAIDTRTSCTEAEIGEALSAYEKKKEGERRRGKKGGGERLLWHRFCRCRSSLFSISSVMSSMRNMVKGEKGKGEEGKKKGRENHCRRRT